MDNAGKPGPIHVLAGRDDAELGGFMVNEQGTTAALLWNVAGRNELAFVNLDSGIVIPGPTLPAEISGGLTFSKDGGRLAITVSGANAPPDIWILEVASGRWSRVTQTPHTGVDLATLVRPELVKFKAHDGLELTGWLYRPAGQSRPGPYVVSFHGGPEGQERPGFRSDYQALVAQGIGVFAPNVRGSSGFGKRFVNLDNGPLRVEGIKDLEDCVTYLVSNRIADPAHRNHGARRRVHADGGHVLSGPVRRRREPGRAGQLLHVLRSDGGPGCAFDPEYGEPKTQADLLMSLSR